MATTLWPIIHRLSNLLSLKTALEGAVDSNATSPKIAVLRTEFESTAKAIRTALTHWRPNLPRDFVPDDAELSDPAAVVEVVDGELDGVSVSASDAATPHASESTATEKRRLNSIFHNALAYKHSAFVYLYRTIYSLAPLARARTAPHPPGSDALCRDSLACRADERTAVARSSSQHAKRAACRIASLPARRLSL